MKNLAVTVGSLVLPLFLAAGATAQDAPQSGTSVSITLMTRDIVVAADGSSAETLHVEIRANNEAGAQQLGQVSLNFDEKLQEMTVVEAHTQKPDGQSVPVAATAIYDQAPADQSVRLLTSLKSKVIVFPQFGAGDTAVYTIKTINRQPLFAGQYFSGDVFSPAVDYDEVRETITAPKSLPLHIESHDVEYQSRQTATDITYSWHYSAPKSSDEAAWSISPLDHMPRFFASSFKDYAQLGQAYGALAQPKMAVTDKIAVLADSITKGVDDRREQARRLYEWVSSHIRYVAIELGTGTFVPHDTDSIVANGYGDCKDHDVLLQALLKAKGIAAESVLINADNDYTLTAVASATGLNHVITYLPEFDLYADSTAAVAPFGVLPMQEYGKPAILVSAASAHAGQMPLLKPGEAKIVTKTVESIGVDGILSGTTTTTGTGPYAITLRMIGLGIQALGPTMAATRVMAVHGYQDASGSFSQDAPAALTSSHTISGSFKASGWSEYLSGKSSFLLPGGLRVADLSGDGPMGPFNPDKKEAERPTLCFSAQATEDLSLKAPPGEAFDGTPDDVTVKTANLTFTAHWALEGDIISVHRDFISKIGQQFCSGKLLDETVTALKKIGDSYDVNIAFKTQKEKVDTKEDGGANALRASASAHFRDNQYDLALADDNKLVAMQPDDADAYTARGIIYDKLQQGDLALADYAKSLTIRPDPMVYFYQAGIYKSRKNYDLALASMDKALALDPDNGISLYGRALFYEDYKKFKLALADLDKAIALQPKNSTLYWNRAMVRYQNEEVDAALEDANYIVIHDPENTTVYGLRSKLYALKGQDAAALADAEKALQSNPNDTLALYASALSNFHIGKLDKALADCQKLMADNHDAENYQLRGEIEKKMGKKAAAAIDISQATWLRSKSQK